MTAEEQRGLSKDFRRVGLMDLFDDVRRAVNSLRKEIDLGDYGRLQDDFTTADVGGWKVNMDYADKGDHLELSVDVEGVTAELDDGVLNVTIPKNGEGGTRKVQIH